MSTSRPSSRRSAHSRPRPSARDPSSGPVIGKLDYRPGGRPLLPPEHPAAGAGSSARVSSSHERSYAGSFFEDVADGIASKQRQRMNQQVLRYLSFAWAIINTLGAGSITAYSLYAPLFQTRLRYSQLQVNGVSITAELAMYLPVPLFGLLCDRTGPGLPSLLAGCFFGLGYLLAAFAYKSGPPPSAGGDGWPYWVMVLAFVGVGAGTSCMYLGAVTTCAKNFGRGRYKGLALALPIAAFGLSGMWQSQVGSHLLCETTPDGKKGDVDVHRFFLFLGTFLLAAGIIGFFTLRIVNEDELIDEALDELEASGMLEDSAFFQRSVRSHSHGNGQLQPGYGTLPTDSERRLSAEEVEDLRKKAEEHRAWLEERERKKQWLLNEETKFFLSDHTMWWLTAGVFLVTGPGEAFINNLGTIVGTLYEPGTSQHITSPATHVSIVAITSTAARIITGTLTDLLAPASPPGQHRRNPHSLSASLASLDAAHQPHRRLEVSRIYFLLAFSLLMSAGQVLLATGLLQNHGNLFWIISAAMGSGYGAVFSLAPIIVSVVWGVENFGTNWGIVTITPAIGATVWGLAYSGVYQWAADKGRAERMGAALAVGGFATGGQAGSREVADDVLCYGAMCYAPTFGAMAVSVWIACGLWIWAWRGPGGWRARGIAV
jgi:MFS family permease